MRRAEAARQARFNEEQTADGSGEAAAAQEKLSLLAPAVQRLLDEEKRKRERPAGDASPAGASAAGAAASPDSAASPAANASGAKLPPGAADEDESPGTKRARTSAALNFLTQHAEAAKNSKARQRGRKQAAAAAQQHAGVNAGTKLDLAGLKTEREMKAQGSSASSSGSAATPGSMPPPPPRVHHPLHFKFNEGCTNAVRRTVHIAHFLPL